MAQQTAALQLWTVRDAFAADADGVKVEVSLGSPPRVVSYAVKPDGSGVPFFLSGQILAARLLRMDAEAVLQKRLEADKKKTGGDEGWRRTPEMAPYLEAAAADMDVGVEETPLEALAAEEDNEEPG